MKVTTPTCAGLRLMPLLFALALSLPSAADDLPELGDKSQALLSYQQEAGIAEDALRYMREQDDWLGDMEVNEYLTSVVAKLANGSPEVHQRFHVYALNEPSVNAFAIPGGMLCVHTELILTTANESELASVLGHEMAHVTQHHLARMLAKQQSTMWPTMAAMAMAILAAHAGSDVPMATLSAASAYNAQSQLTFQRDNEREADRVGIHYLEQSGFDPHAMPTFFANLQQHERFVESNAPVYLRTHPVTPERIADAQGRVANLPYRQYPDSLDYLLVKEKVRVLTRPLEVLRKEYTQRMAGNSGQAALVARYGQARLLLREADTAQAYAIALPLENSLPHPMVSELIAEILMAQGKPEAALQYLQEARSRYPNRTALVEEEIEAALGANQPQTALTATEDGLTLQPDDPEWYEWRARAFDKLDRQSDSHAALAEYYWRLGATGDAMRQLRIAQTIAKLSPEQQLALKARITEMQKDKREHTDSEE